MDLTSTAHVQPRRPASYRSRLPRRIGSAVYVPDAARTGDIDSSGSQNDMVHGIPAQSNVSSFENPFRSLFRQRDSNNDIEENHKLNVVSVIRQDPYRGPLDAETLAINHYQAMLLKRVFSGIHRNWWLNRREWRAEIRADCMHEHNVLNRAWNLWRSAATNRDMIIRADCFYAKLQIQRSFNAWCDYLILRRRKEVQSRRAIRWHQKHMKCHVFETFRKALVTKKHRHQLSTRAKRADDLRILKFSWDCWCRLQAHQIELRKEFNRAELHAERALMRTSLKAWCSFTEHSRNLHAMESKADAWREHRAINHGWNIWNDASLWNRTVLRLQPSVETLSRRVQLRFAVQKWKVAVIQAKCARAHEAEADQHYLSTISRKAMFKLMSVLKCRKEWRRLAVLASMHADRKLLQRSWNIIVAHYDLRVEEQMRGYTMASRVHYHQSLLRRALLGWRSWAKRERIRLRSLRHQAKIQDSETVQQAFNTWVRYVQDRYRQRALDERSYRLYRTKMCSSFFLHWQHALTTSRLARRMDTESVRYHKTRLVAKHFTSWRVQYSKARSRRLQLQEAAQYGDMKLKKVIFSNWREYVCLTKQERLAHTRAIIFSDHQRLLTYWNQWTLVVKEKRHMAFFSAVADHHMKLHKLKYHFKLWIVKVSQSRQNHLLLQRGTSHFHRQLLGKTLQIWIGAAKQSKYDKELMSRATGFARLKLFKKGFKAFQENILFAHQRIENIDHFRTRIVEVKNQKTKAKAFQLWLTLHKESALLRRMNTMATDQYSYNLLRKTFAQLRDWTKLRQNKTSIMTRAIEHDRQKMYTNFFKRWRLASLERRYAQQQNLVALWFWSIQIKGRAWRILKDKAREMKNAKESDSITDFEVHFEEVVYSRDKPKLPKFLLRSDFSHKPNESFCESNTSNTIANQKLRYIKSSLSDYKDLLQLRKHLRHQLAMGVVSAGLGEKLANVESSITRRRPDIAALHLELSRMQSQYTLWS